MLKLSGVKTNQLLSLHTTFGIGGPAQYFFTAKTVPDLIKAVKAGRQAGLPIFIFGGGSNLLVSDQGVKGLVIKNLTNTISVLDQPANDAKPSSQTKPRFQQLKNQSSFTAPDDSYDESEYPQVLVKLDSGVKFARAIHFLLDLGITGLEWFAGIPATIGGGVYINIHGGKKFISDYLVSAEILDKSNQVKSVGPSYFNFDYDLSSIKDSKDIVLTATLRLFKGPVDKARDIATAWARHKHNQPQRSAGCIFQNLSKKDQTRLKLPTSSSGYLIDKVLNLKGTKIGQAQIADRHAGFVENLGTAKADDVFQLIKLVKDKAKQKLDLDFRLEIVPVGFSVARLKAIGEFNHG